MLRSLWASRLRHLASAVAEEQTDHEEIANLAEHVGHDYAGRFLIELLQNANDQATKAHLDGGPYALGAAGLVVVVRTPELVTVLNQGAPLDQDGLNSISSLGISGKDAAIQVGNKGIGFKSVYQVTATPMIFSAPAGSALDAVDRDECLRIELALKPFAQHPPLVEFLRDEASRLPTTRADVWRLLLEKAGDAEGALEAVLDATRRAAPFKFPIPVDAQRARHLLNQLGLPAALLQQMQTAVLLPIHDEAEEVVDTALKEIHDQSTQRPAGHIVLPTPGIDRLLLLDHVLGVYQFHRRVLLGTEPLPRSGVAAFEVLTEVHSAPTAEEIQRTANEDGRAPDRSTRWFGARSVLGGAQSGSDQEQARREIRDAIARSKLPKGWDNVKEVPVVVAVPSRWPNRTDLAPTPLGTGGRVTIGLPTFHGTGTPWWVDSRFHGNISRTDLQLTSPYNDLLVREAVRLIADVVHWLRRSAERSRRQLATLCLEAEASPDGVPTREVAACLWAPGALGHQHVVLAADGIRYLRVDELRLPSGQDVDFEGLRVFEALTEPVPVQKLGALGLVMPDAGLHHTARPALDKMLVLALGPKAAWATAVPPVAYLKRQEAPLSLVEALAASKRTEGPTFWKRFLGWLMARFTVGQLDDQKFLPVGLDALARPSDRVYLPLANAGDVQEDIVREDLPDALRNTLGFLDEHAVVTRREDGRKLTDFAAQLAPDRGGGLVRRPRRQQVLQDVVAPALAAAVDQRRFDEAAALLRLTIKWALDAKGLTPGELPKIPDLRVPMQRPERATETWLHPTRAYFGRGWLGSPDHEKALDRAYGPVGQTLSPWDEFCRRMGLDPDDDRSSYERAMSALGVERAPRLLAPAVDGEAPFHDGWRNRLTRRPEAKCPFHDELGLQPYWERWVEGHVGGVAATRSGDSYHYRFEETRWIEGLEREESRIAIFELMLLEPSKYIDHVFTRTVRAQGGYKDDPARANSFWAHTLVVEGWGLVETTQGRRPPRDVWLLNKEERRRRGTDLLAVARAVPTDAWPFLSRLGAITMEDAPADRLITELSRLAGRLAEPEVAPAEARALAGHLFELLPKRLRINDTMDQEALERAFLPLQRGDHERPEAVCLGSLQEDVYVADDPARATFVPDWPSRLRVPGEAKVLGQELIRALDRVARGGHVYLTSECPIETGFVALDEPKPLLAWLAGKLEPRVVDDVAAVAAHVGSGAASIDPVVEGSRFRKTWDRLQACRIAFGTFRREMDAQVFYEQDGGLLQVRVELQDEPHEVVASLWVLVGIGVMDAFAAYASALRDRQLAHFFHRRGVGKAEFERLRTVTGRSEEPLHRRHVEGILALWRTRDASCSVAWLREFVERHDATLDQLERRTGISSLGRRLEDARDLDPSQAARQWMEGIEGGVATWQGARRDLGLLPYRFRETEMAVRLARQEAAYHFMSEAVRVGTAGEVPALATALSEWLDAPVDEHLLERDPKLVPVRELVARSLLEKLAGSGAPDLSAHVAARLIDADHAWTPLGTTRDVAAYKADPAAQRSSLARKAVECVLKVAAPLAARLGEPLIEGEVLVDPAVRTYSDGTWANRYAVLLAVKASLQRLAPRTEAVLSSERVFANPVDQWRLLWEKFPDLGPAPDQAQSPPPPPRAVTILDESMRTDEVALDLMKGSRGLLGGKLCSRAALGIDLSGFRQERQRLEALVEPPPSSRGHGHTPRTSQRTEEQNELTGLLGEAFAYELLRHLLPEDAQLRWVSKSAARYGVDGADDDGAGCDLRARDVGGLLTGIDGADCYIEVKATHGAADGPFPMSWNEWRLARECHGDPERCFVILRIANADASPELADVIIDPIGLEASNQLRVHSKDLWVQVGRQDKDAAQGPSA